MIDSILIKTVAIVDHHYPGSSFKMDNITNLKLLFSFISVDDKTIILKGFKMKDYLRDVGDPSAESLIKVVRYKGGFCIWCK